MRRCLDCRHLFKGLRSDRCGFCRQDYRNAVRREKRQRLRQQAERERAQKSDAWIEARLQQLEAEARQKRWTA